MTKVELAYATPSAWGSELTQCAAIFFNLDVCFGYFERHFCQIIIVIKVGWPT